MNLPGITPRSEQDLTALVNQFGDGVAAYIYGYPLVIFGITEQLSANTKPSSTSGSAPLNQFGKQTEFPDSIFTAVVLPSTSTLYASAFLNLKKEPIILHLPDFGDRYFVMPLLDGWTNVNPDSPGTRLGSQEGDYVIVGPDYEADPKEFRGMTVLHMDTSSVWIIRRVFTHGTTKDLKYVKKKLYPKLTLTPDTLEQAQGQNVLPAAESADRSTGRPQHVACRTAAMRRRPGVFRKAVRDDERQSSESAGPGHAPGIGEHRLSLRRWKRVI